MNEIHLCRSNKTWMIRADVYISEIMELLKVTATDTAVLGCIMQCCLW
jgi:hypothetical protein